MLWTVPPGTTSTGGIASVRKGSFLCLNDGGTFLQRGARPPLFHPFLLLGKPLVLSITMGPPPLEHCSPTVFTLATIQQPNCCFNKDLPQAS